MKGMLTSIYMDNSRMPWASDPSIKIDRFDGRALLDFLPSTTASMIESGLRLDRDEDGIGNELRFQRWHDLVDRARLRVSEEQCLADNEEEWNDLVARHHALIGKLPDKHKETADAPSTTHNFAYNYGTETPHGETEMSQLAENELTALEEDNILEHLDDLSGRDRDYLDNLGAEFYIQDYYQLLRDAKQDQDARVMQLKVTAVNLERTLAGKKPLKASEIEGMLNSTAGEKDKRNQNIRRRGRRGRSSSPAHRGTRRSSPSYEPYLDSSSRSGSESPKKDKVEFIMEFEGESTARDEESWMDIEPSPPQSSTDATKSRSVSAKGAANTQHSHGAQASGRDSYSTGIESTKMSLAEKLKQRMRQGLDQSSRSLFGFHVVVLT
ncbi:hypothetical protein BGX31_007768 [Mortierella sp. GBA43]|nr:hypothetical protein BGX31_007768 [Mortierella sp. GBA43]